MRTQGGGGSRRAAPASDDNAEGDAPTPVQGSGGARAEPRDPWHDPHGSPWVTGPVPDATLTPGRTDPTRIHSGPFVMGRSHYR
ncbi:hypothetical protein GCM10009564_20990 [Streptomyces thermogriseus]|uniref:Uncharacterized protein n=1 Tax=Streptomyces thermogriseus TaxID=75292 RepID=A0ABN1SXZ7_9ACTN